MKLSIIVPVYQVEKFLERCVDSLLDQKDFSDYEIILVDDGSADESSQTCDEYLLKCDRIRVVHKKNGGLSDARNYGLDAACGEYVWFVDSDDFIRENCISELIDFADDRYADVVSFNFSYIQDQYSVRENDIFVDIGDRVVTGSEWLSSGYRSEKIIMAACFNIFRKALITENRLYFKTGVFHEDEEWTPRVLYHANRVAQFPKSIYGYYIRSGSITNDAAKHRRASLDLIENCEALKEFGARIDDQELKQLFENNIVTLALSAYFIGDLIDRHDWICDLISDLCKQKRNSRKVKVFKTFPRGYIALNKLTKQLGRVKKAGRSVCSFARKCRDYAKQKIHKFARKQFVCKKQVADLKNHRFSIISSTCNGGVITSELREQFRTPTINLFLSPADYLKFAENLEYYLSLDVVEKTNSFERFPVGTIGDVTLNFMHYHSFDEARRKWNERKKRVNYDDLFFMMAEKDGCTPEMVRQFDSLPYQNKVIFTANEYPDCASAVCVAPDAKNGEAPIMTDYVGLTHRIYDKYFDYVGWLNGSGV